MLLQIEVKRKMLGRSVTFEPRSVEKHFQQQNFFELTTPNVDLILNETIMQGKISIHTGKPGGHIVKSVELVRLSD